MSKCPLDIRSTIICNLPRRVLKCSTAGTKIRRRLEVARKGDHASADGVVCLARSDINATAELVLEVTNRGVAVVVVEGVAAAAPDVVLTLCQVVIGVANG